MSDHKWNSEGKVCTACAALQYSECNHVRGGKTAYEKSAGVWANRFSNRSQRESWQRSKGAKFPAGACNGKRNRFHV